MEEIKQRLIKVAKPCHQAAWKQGEQKEEAKYFNWDKTLMEQTSHIHVV